MQHIEKKVQKQLVIQFGFFLERSDVIDDYIKEKYELKTINYNSDNDDQYKDAQFTFI